MAMAVRQLEGEKFDLSIEVTFVKDKFKQARAEKEALVEEIDTLKVRIAKATQDYAQILDHREGQIKAHEARVVMLQTEREKLQGMVQERDVTIEKMQKQSDMLQDKLAEAASVLADKERLEDTVVKQTELITRQVEELANLKDILGDREASLAASRYDNQELQLKASVTKELKILFDEPWIVEMTHHRLKGDRPPDREGHTLIALPGKVILMGGQGKGESMGRETWHLDLESLKWEAPSSARLHWTSIQGSCAPLGRTKLLCQGGYRNEALTSMVSVLNTEQWKWLQPNIKEGATAPAARVGHSLVCIRERIFMFGGLTEHGLTNETWVLDLDSLLWTEVLTFGALPPPRMGAAIVASENGRRLYVFGGSDGVRTMNDVFMLETERFHWSVLGVTGTLPPSREGHSAVMLSSFMVISGGVSRLPDGMKKRTSDTWALHLVKGMWEQIDEGSWSNGVVWLKPNSTYTAMWGNKIFSIKPDRDEKLWELQVVTLILPEHLERLRAAKKKDELVDVLELMNDVVSGATFLEISWRPPTKNGDHIDRYKLMMATTTGVVKEVAQGSMLRHRVTNLYPSTEYIFCVKALYQDGSFLWSESKSYMTTSR